MSDEEKEEAKKDYSAALWHREEYLQALRDREQLPEFRTAPRKLVQTVRDLEQRGLLQYDGRTRRHDLHPVVRSVVVGDLRSEEKDRFGWRVLDHFSRQPQRPNEEVETPADVSDGVQVVRTLLQMGRHQQACNAYCDDLSVALTVNLEAHAEVLSLLRPFFPHGWAALPDDLHDGSYLANDAGVALHATGALQEALAAYTAGLQAELKEADSNNVIATLCNISFLLGDKNRLARSERCLVLALDLAVQLDDEKYLFRPRLARFGQFARSGRWKEGEAMWQLLDPMGRHWPRATYRPGRAEHEYAKYRFWQGQLTEEHLAKAEQLAKLGKNRLTIRELHGLRGAWHLEQGRLAPAAESLHEAVRLTREVGLTDAEAETQLTIAQFHLGQIPDPREAAERIARVRRPFHRGLAELWLALGDHERAKQHACKACEWAWADGEPYVHRYELNKARALLKQLGAEIPDLPPYDTAEDEKLPWEDDVTAAIEKLRAEKDPKGRANT